jgi:hypothetical protein
VIFSADLLEGSVLVCTANFAEHECSHAR